ncbi:O-acetyl-ADP-ribose deacetylase [Niveibacterium terrae]|uniref:O-acetyl-ADP-ribose deacetylase n=1 Tax=Niveibacterium terrae TaxID=3373598 RepID=UPI003A8D35C5
MTALLRALCADITTLAVDAIVNAANKSLLGGGGVDGAIHRAAGPELLEACRKLGGCQVGDAKLTPGFRLPARHVLHTVGPVWRGGGCGEGDELARCYRRCIEIANTSHFTSIAFPAISTGTYGFPFADAAKIAIAAVAAATEEPGSVEDVIFCCFDPDDEAIYETLLAAV